MAKGRPERVERLMKRFGFSRVRGSGNHVIFEDTSGVRVSISKSPNSEIHLNPKQLRRIIQQKRRAT